MGSLSLGLALLLVACQVALITPRTRTVKLGDHVKLENTAYIYQSVIESYLQYEAARKVGEAGLMTRAGDKDHVCYHGYGCFFKNGTYGNFWRLPASPQSVTTGFHLYRSADQEDPEFLDYKNVTTLIESSFRGDQPTVVMLHGFGSGPWSPWSGRMKAAVFRGHPEVNYIFTDWSAGARAPDYWGASANTQMVAVQVAKLIAGLNAHKGSTSASFHLIGHSLGAHIAGFTAHRLQILGHEKVGKITGLDPAGPIFDGGHPDALLSKGDADFVMGIHGNADAMMYGGLGLYSRVGDIDFYPNGGKTQPGCPHMVWGVITNLASFNWGNIPESAKCNHNRAIEFAVESVGSPCSHVSYGCDTYEAFKEGHCFGGEIGVMGLFASNQPAEKEHFLVTKASDGYCAHAMKISLKLADTSPSSKGSLFVTLVGQNGVEESIEQMADDETLPSGKLVVEIVASRTLVSNLTAIKIRFQPDCWGWWCSAERITASWVEIDSLESDGHGDHKCAGFQVLYKGDTVNIPLTNCNTPL